ncbi:MAG: NAD(P)H-hydrate dehydratase [Ruminiclostridium sp.]|nr:NAD(P)H-hydrate dehydratase [Ruminiclostridium sp.]
MLNINRCAIDKQLISSIMPIRFKDSSKGDYGKVIIITGSIGMTGSGCLCANAAMRSGAGLVYVGVPAGLSTVYSTKLTEPIIIALQDNGGGSLSAAGSARIIEAVNRMDAAAIGPGLSVNDEIVEVVRNVIKRTRIPLVLDADALNAASRDISMLKECNADAVITPHPGEMARLTGLSIREVQNDRLKVAADFAEQYGVTVVLKGSGTVVALPDGTIYVNTTGNPGMATGGAGDVLTGIIASLAGQGVKLSDAAVAGVYLHGLAGDAAAGKKGMHGMIASDIIEELPYVIKEIAAKP